MPATQQLTYIDWTLQFSDILGIVIGFWVAMRLLNAREERADARDRRRLLIEKLERINMLRLDFMSFMAIVQQNRQADFSGEARKELKDSLKRMTILAELHFPKAGPPAVAALNAATDWFQHMDLHGVELDSHGVPTHKLHATLVQKLTVFREALPSPGDF